MKKMIAALAAMSLAACASLPITSAKTLTEANNLIADAAGQFHNALLLGQVTKAQAKTEAAWVDAASVYSRNAQCAMTAGDLTTVNGAISAITVYANAIIAVQGGKPVPTLPSVPAPLACNNATPVSAVAAN